MAPSHTVLLVHSSGPQGPGEGSEPLVGRLRDQLGGDYEISELGSLEGKVVLFGHSLGGSVVLKYLAEEGPDERIAGLVCVAAPFWGTAEWEREWALPEGWRDEETELPPTFLFHSRDDEYSPFASLDLYAARLPGATARPLDGYGHLFERGDLSEIAAAVRSL